MFIIKIWRMKNKLVLSINLFKTIIIFENTI